MPDQRPIDYGSPFMTWDQLPDEVREDVLRLAETGQFHRDRRVRRLAYTWAEPVAKQRTWGLWLGAAFQILSAAMSMGQGAEGMPWDDFTARKQARAIVALGRPTD